jgi:predicted nucleic acid-binding protein
MRILVDSSVLVEYEKQTKPDLLEALLASEHQVCINPIVFSEYVYQLLGVMSGKSPLSVCENGKINEVLALHDTIGLLSAFQILPMPTECPALALSLMKKYNLLPNDALIVASCHLSQVKALASYDADFQTVCKAESIQLLTQPQDLP